LVCSKSVRKAAATSAAFLKAYSITLTSQVVGSGNATVNIELAVPGNATIGDEGILFDIVFSALGVTSKTYRVDTFISVVSPLTASPPSPQDAKTISSPALFGLFLAVTIFRRSRKPRIP